MEDAEYISSSDSESDSNSELRVIPATRSAKRRRLGPAPETQFLISCSGCTKSLEADSNVYFLPFCSCLYCGTCMLKPILEGLLQLNSALGRAAFDMIRNKTKPSSSVVNMFTCKRLDHLQIPGAVECYGTACSICTLEGSLGCRRVYLHCGHAFCEPHIAKWFEDKEMRTCPTCRSDVPKEDAHFKSDGTYALGWPRRFS